MACGFQMQRSYVSVGVCTVPSQILVQILVKRKLFLKFFPGKGLHLDLIRRIGRQQLLCLGGQHGAAAVVAADGGREQLAAEGALRRGDNPPSLGLGHFHRGCRRPQGLVQLYPFQQRGNTRAKAALVVIGVHSNGQL